MRSTTATTDAIKFYPYLYRLAFYVCALGRSERRSLHSSLKPSGFSVSFRGKLPFRPPSQFDSSKNMKIKAPPTRAVFDFVPSKESNYLLLREGDVLSIELLRAS